MPKSSRRTMKRSSSGSDSDWSGSSKSSKSSSSSRRRLATGARSRRTTAARTAEVFPPKPRVGHPNQLPKPELRAKLMAPVLTRVGTTISSISEVTPETRYLVMATNRKNQPVAYCLKATGTVGNKGKFYMRDSRSAGFGVGAGELIAGTAHIYKITPELKSSLEAEGMWFNENEYSR